MILSNYSLPSTIPVIVASSLLHKLQGTLLSFHWLFPSPGSSSLKTLLSPPSPSLCKCLTSSMKPTSWPYTILNMVSSLVSMNCFFFCPLQLSPSISKMCLFIMLIICFPGCLLKYKLPEAWEHCFACWGIPST